MQFLLVLSVALGVACASVVPSIQSEEDLTIFGYHRRFGIPNADQIQKTEESFPSEGSRIIGGATASHGQFPFQAGLIISLIDGRRSVCGGSIITNIRSLTAAHCWYDGENQAFQFEVVLGSLTLFSGGTRFTTNSVQMHEAWNPNGPVDRRFHHDLAIIGHSFVTYTPLIQPIALPSGVELSDSFSGEMATVSGYGANSDMQMGIPQSQLLHNVNVTILDNSVCRRIFSDNVHDGTICTSGSGRLGVCGGDSGGPLIVTRNNRPIQVGVVSYGFILCEFYFPSAYVRLPYYINWINQRL